MSESVTIIAVPSYAGVTIRNQLYHRDGHKRLMVLLPGRGYTVTAPLLHYNFTLGWFNGYDVLQVQYGFHAAQTDLHSKDIPAIHQESAQAVEQALASHDYEALVLVGKSLGTPIAAMFASQFALTSKTILLTPIQKCYQLVKTIPTLAVIGTDDPAYSEGMAVDTAVLRWKVYDGLDHALEKPGDVMASLAALQDIIQACADFVLGD